MLYDVYYPKQSRKLKKSNIFPKNSAFRHTTKRRTHSIHATMKVNEPLSRSLRFRRGLNAKLHLPGKLLNAVDFELPGVATLHTVSRLLKAQTRQSVTLAVNLFNSSTMWKNKFGKFVILTKTPFKFSASCYVQTFKLVIFKF